MKVIKSYCCHGLVYFHVTDEVYKCGKCHSGVKNGYVDQDSLWLFRLSNLTRRSMNIDDIKPSIVRSIVDEILKQIKKAELGTVVKLNEPLNMTTANVKIRGDIND